MCTPITTGIIAAGGNTFNINMLKAQSKDWAFFCECTRSHYSTGLAGTSGFSGFSFLKSSFPNFQVKLIPTERKGIFLVLLIVKLGPYKTVG